jgi:hypothetical protein
MKWETLMVVCFLFRGGAETNQGVECKVLIFIPRAKYLWMVETYKKSSFVRKKGKNLKH